MANSPEHERVLELQDIIVGTQNVAEFLERLSVMAAGALSRDTSAKVECGVTLKRRRRTFTVAGSSPKAVLLDEIEQRIGDGPCIEALRVKEPVLLADVDKDPRWPEYRKALADEGCRATLGVPLELGEDAAAALNFFAFESGVFTPAVIREAVEFADLAGGAVRLSVKLGTAQSLADDLAAAMESRTSIDLACGVIMGQNRCTQAEAMAILTKVSSNRNQKLRTVAEEMLANLAGGDVRTHFDA
ncbi:putative GAF sensor protein [Arthrobacter sp. FB24]|uniref:GAF and ANTAR domain-containing protein n=1 Tax=Arthrobacter sp. (strain FB24) TaxID=290399 RepID=UPI000052748C|nr:GAF and ANTAR domain-containing protein [Arthrobacter sp. FB24]ABK04551.1 putative GAF sensor protein [Arthrobacter sp. FB24]